MEHRTLTTRDLSDLCGRTLRGESGEDIGQITDVYLDEATNQPEWLAVHTGMFGTRRSFVPISELSRQGEGLSVPFSKDRVKDAPTAEVDGFLSAEEEERLYRHYDIDYGTGMFGTGEMAADDTRTSSPPNSGRDTAMTRSEEEVRVGTQRQEAGRARLRKWIDTEHVQQTVPVQHEEVRVVRESLTDHDPERAAAGSELGEDVQEITLSEEQVVVQKEVVPKERIRLEKEVVIEQQPVEADVRKERIELEEGMPRDREPMRRDR